MFNEASNGWPRRWPRYWFLIPVAVVAAALALGWAVMFLWNAILPEVVGARPLNFWQAVGLLVLCRLLFGGFGGRGGRPGGGPRRGGWRGRWATMSEEERARFRAEWAERCRKREG